MFRTARANTTKKVALYRTSKEGITSLSKALIIGIFNILSKYNKLLVIYNEGPKKRKRRLKSVLSSLLRQPFYHKISIHTFIAVAIIKIAKTTCNIFVFIFCPTLAPIGEAIKLETINTAAGKYEI